MAIRRDYTNGSGYICPTENTAVYNLDKPTERPVTPRPYKTTLREADCRRLDRKTPMQQLAEIAAGDTESTGNAEQLKRVRQLWSALASIAQMMDCSIVSIEIKAKGGDRYYKTDTMAVLERK